MKKIEKSIIIVGKICSGKSTLAKELSIQLNFSIVSFGGYLLDYAKHNSLPFDRESLQDLGTHMVESDAGEFLRNAINFSAKNSRDLIFEGVRHKVIFEEIDKISKRSFSLYADVNMEERLRRFLNREKEIDILVNEKDFLARNSHKVESEIEEIKSLCDTIIDSNQLISQINIASMFQS